jgi:DNA mismatch endonuclease, patch repair protein
MLQKRVPNRLMDNLTPVQRARLMRSIRTRGTAPEKTLGSALKDAGLAYRCHVKSVRGTPDFLMTAGPIAVFVHGCFWHGHDGCRRAVLPRTNACFWREKIGRNIRRDKRVARQLRREGYGVVTVWACQLNDPTRVVRRIQRAQNRRKSSEP